jgi:hypothetical protein
MTASERISTLNSLLIQMSVNEQDALIKALKKEVLRAKARRLDSSVIPNNISIEEIIEEVRKEKIREEY